MGRMYFQTIYVVALVAIIFTSLPVLAAQIFTADRVCRVRSEPNSSSSWDGRLYKDDKAQVLERPSGTKWIKVRTADRRVGWVYGPRGTITQDQAVAPSPPTSGEMLHWFGNMHAHTSEDSSESGAWDSTHEDAFNYAMDDSKGNLDFLAVTPHTHLVKEETYAKLWDTTRNSTYYKPGKFVPIAGQEYSKTDQGNHLNVFELERNGYISPSNVPNGEFKTLYETHIPNHDTKLTFAQFNHPHSVKFSAQNGKEYGRDDYGSDMDKWIKASDPIVQAIEVVRAPSHQSENSRVHKDEYPKRMNAWLWAIGQGWKLGPTANQDNHRNNWGSASDSRTVALAPSLTRDAILSAFRERRFYASEDSTLKVWFMAGDVWMGSVIKAEDFEDFTVKAEDSEEPNAVYTFDLFSGVVDREEQPLKYNSTPDQTMTLTHGQEGTFALEEVNSGTFHYVRVTQSKTPDDPNDSEDNAWTSPIWMVGEAH